MSEESRKRLGYWISQKKCKKLSFVEIEDAFRERNIEPVKIDLEKPLDGQGPFHGILHKLTDFIAKAELGDTEAQKLLNRVETYVRDNPNTRVMDSFESLRTLINRYKTYCIISQCQLFKQETAIFIPPFVQLQTDNFQKNVHVLRVSNIQFPAVCKPVVAHGSNSAHQMTLIFNEDGLKEVIYPCVVQTFVNHNAVLYKLFVLGENYTTVVRPSIRNFYSCEGMAPIHFDGGEVSKANSSSKLAVQDSRMANGHPPATPCPKLLTQIVHAIRDCMGLGLFGVDVIAEEGTGRVGVVDINAFPGYEGVTNFPGKLADLVREELDKCSNGMSVRYENACNGISDGESRRTSERLIHKTSIA